MALEFVEAAKAMKAMRAALTVSLLASVTAPGAVAMTLELAVQAFGALQASIASGALARAGAAGKACCG